MEFLLEVLFEVVFEVVFEVLVDLGFGRTSRVLRSNLVRGVLGAAIGFVLGVLWGAHVAGAELAHRPRLLWVSVVVAVLCLVQALIARYGDRPSPGGRPRWWHDLDPRRWPPGQLVGFAASSAAVAIGIEVGFA